MSPKATVAGIFLEASLDIELSGFSVDITSSDDSILSVMAKTREKERHAFLQRVKKVALTSDYDFQLGRIKDGYVLLDESAGWVVCRVEDFRVADCGYFTTQAGALRFLFLKISGLKDLSVSWR